MHIKEDAHRNAEENTPQDEHDIVHGSRLKDGSNLKHDSRHEHDEFSPHLPIQASCTQENTRLHWTFAVKSFCMRSAS
jgi:hypothetical protein